MNKKESSHTEIILVVRNRLGKTTAFITDAFETLSLESVISHIQNGLLQGSHIVETKSGIYVRSDRNQSKADNLGNLTVPAGSLSEQIAEVTLKDKVVQAYLKAYGKFLELRYDKDELIYLDKIARATKTDVTRRLKPLVSEIKKSAKIKMIDQQLLGAILIDELARIDSQKRLPKIGWKLGGLAVNNSLRHNKKYFIGSHFFWSGYPVQISGAEQFERPGISLRRMLRPSGKDSALITTAVAPLLSTLAV